MLTKVLKDRVSHESVQVDIGSYGVLYQKAKGLPRSSSWIYPNPVTYFFRVRRSSLLAHIPPLHHFKISHQQIPDSAESRSFLNYINKISKSYACHCWASSTNLNPIIVNGVTEEIDLYGWCYALHSGGINAYEL